MTKEEHQLQTNGRGAAFSFNVQLHRSELANLEYIHVWELLVRTLEVEETKAEK